MKLGIAVALAIALLSPAADARPQPRRTPAKRTVPAKKPVNPKKLGAVARVNFGRELRPARDQVVGRITEKLTAEEETAAQLQKLLRGPMLRRGVTGLYVADARTGEPLFAVNADDPLNPASNVKLISTATALELLGPAFRYPTRVFGREPVRGVVRGDIYLLGSHDPTLTMHDLDDLASSLAARGITAIEGNVVVGSDPTRDGVYRAIVPIEVVAGEPGQPPTVTAPAGLDLVELKVTATTAKKPMRPRLTYKTEVVKNEAGKPRIVLTVGGTIGKDGHTTYSLWTKQRTAAAGYGLVAALRAKGITFTGELATMELGDYFGDAIGSGPMPVELGRHESQPVAEIVRRINKWSVNWLADRLVMTAAGLAKRKPPSMELAVEAMYAWLARHPQVPKQKVVLDTGSGLSYRTQISPQELVSVVRSAGGFTGNTDAVASKAWLSSLAIAGRDGTLQHRFRGTELREHVTGKTGTLSTVIALAGVLDLDPQRPLAFALVTNTDAPLSKPLVRRAHEQLMAEVARYVARTATRALPQAAPPVVPVPASPMSDEVEETSPDAQLDRETADQP